MYRFSPALLAGLIFAAVPAWTAPAAAQATAQATIADPGQFVIDLTTRVFAVLNEPIAKDAMKAKFKTMLRQNFAVEQAGQRLIRRYRPQLTSAQLSAYDAVLPDYIVNAYADRLINYREATVQVVRTQPRGTEGNVDVFSRVSTPGKQPFDVIWMLQKAPDGRWLIGNLTVAGVNLALTQEADFTAYISRNGFDALVAMMKTANSRIS